MNEPLSIRPAEINEIAPTKRKRKMFGPLTYLTLLAGLGLISAHYWFGGIEGYQRGRKLRSLMSELKTIRPTARTMVMNDIVSIDGADAKCRSLMEDKDPAFRHLGMEYLYRAQPTSLQDFDALFRMLDDPAKGVARDAILYVGDYARIFNKAELGDARRARILEWFLKKSQTVEDPIALLAVFVRHYPTTHEDVRALIPLIKSRLIPAWARGSIADGRFYMRIHATAAESAWLLADVQRFEPEAVQSMYVKLADALADDDPAIGEFAYLLHMYTRREPGPAEVSALMRLLVHRKPLLRLRAAWRIACAEGPLEDRVRSILMDSLNDPDPKNRERNCRNILSLGISRHTDLTKAACDTLENLIRDPAATSYVDTACIRVLLQYRPKSVDSLTSCIINQALDGPAGSRFVACAALESLGGLLNTKLYDRLAPLARDQDPRLRQDFCRILCSTGTWRPGLADAWVKLVSDPDPRVRVTAARSFAGFGPQARPVLPKLIKLYTDRASPMHRSPVLLFGIGAIDNAAIMPLPDADLTKKETED